MACLPLGEFLVAIQWNPDSCGHVWQVCESPVDYRGKWVARHWMLPPFGAEPIDTEEVLVDATHADLFILLRPKLLIGQWKTYLREHSDEPQVRESYIRIKK